MDIPGEPSIPDLSAYLRKPLPANLGRERARLSEPSLLAVKISAPLQGMRAFYEKVDLYFRFGVKSCWVVIAPTRTIHVLTADLEAVFS